MNRRNLPQPEAGLRPKPVNTGRLSWTTPLPTRVRLAPQSKSDVSATSNDTCCASHVHLRLRSPIPVHLTICGVLVGLERRHIIEDAEEVFAIIRGLAAPIVPSQIPPRLNGRLRSR